MDKDEMQALLLKAAQTLDGILPENIRCVVVFGDLNTGEVAAISDLPDDVAADLAGLGVERLRSPDGTQILDLNQEKGDKILH